MPTGYLWSITIPAVCAVAALWPIRRPPFGTMSFMLGYLLSELPFVAFYWLLVSTLLTYFEGNLLSPVGLTGLALAALVTLGLVEVVRRELRAGPALEGALDRELRDRWRRPADAGLRSNWRRILRILFTPFPLWSRSVKRTRNVRYGDAGRWNRLDVYRSREPRQGGSPVLIHFHGGRFAVGGKSREARPLLFRLADEGWVCISANYRLRGAGRFPNSQIDAKKVIAWAREHDGEFGMNASVVVVAGSSAGAHLAAMAALTPNEQLFQPGFEHANTSVTGFVGLYGYYGAREWGPAIPSSPADYLRADAPPAFIAHGTRDSLVPISWAREFAGALGRTSDQSVVYAELPGAHHLFDLFRSLRFEKVVDAIDVFLSVAILGETAGSRIDSHPDDSGVSVE